MQLGTHKEGRSADGLLQGYRCALVMEKTAEAKVGEEAGKVTADGGRALGEEDVLSAKMKMNLEIKETANLNGQTDNLISR